jgi:hypothetical protein
MPEEFDPRKGLHNYHRAEELPHAGGKPDHYHAEVNGHCIACGIPMGKNATILKEIITENGRALEPSSMDELLMQTTLPIDELLTERGKTHGKWDVQSKLAHDLKSILWSSENFAHLPPFMIEAVEMHCTKISRCVCGDPYEPDHWADIAGYARLVEKQLLEGKEHERTREEINTGSGNGPVQA